MAVYPHPREPRVLVAYTWFGSRVPTPRWFDDNDWSLQERHPWLGRKVFMAWARCRAWGIVRVRLWGRA